MTGSAGRAGPLHFECFSLSLTNEVSPTGLGVDARPEAGGFLGVDFLVIFWLFFQGRFFSWFSNDFLMIF